MSAVRHKTPFITGEKAVGRDTRTGRFLPGNNANPHGRPIGSRGDSAFLREELARIAEGSDRSYAELIARRLILNAVAGRERSIEIILDRTEGKVTDKFVGEVTKTVTHAELMPNKGHQLVEEFNARLRKLLDEEMKNQDSRNNLSIAA